MQGSRQESIYKRIFFLSRSFSLLFIHNCVSQVFFLAFSSVSVHQMNKNE